MSIAAVREQRVVSPTPTESRAPGDSTPPAAVSSGEPSVFAGVLQGLGQEMRRGETLMRSAMRSAVGVAAGGRDIGPAELIALQAGVYRYGEVVDLASRLIDRATSGVKTVLQGQ